MRSRPSPSSIGLRRSSTSVGRSAATTSRASSSAWCSNCFSCNPRERSSSSIYAQRISSGSSESFCRPPQASPRAGTRLKGELTDCSACCGCPVCAGLCICLCPTRRYLRALAAFYVRLTFDAIDVYETLEPMLDDYRKLRYRGLGKSGTLSKQSVQAVPAPIVERADLTTVCVGSPPALRVSKSGVANFYRRVLLNHHDGRFCGRAAYGGESLRGAAASAHDAQSPRRDRGAVKATVKIGEGHGHRGFRRRRLGCRTISKPYAFRKRWKRWRATSQVHQSISILITRSPLRGLEVTLPRLQAISRLTRPERPRERPFCLEITVSRWL